MSKFDNNFDDDGGFLGGFGFSDTGTNDSDDSSNDGSFGGLSYSNTNKNTDNAFSFGDDDFYEYDPSANEKSNNFNIPLNNNANISNGFGSMNNNGFDGMSGNAAQPSFSDSGFSQEHDNAFGSDNYVPLNQSAGSSTYTGIGGEIGSDIPSNSSYTSKKGLPSNFDHKLSFIIYLISAIMFIVPLAIFFIPTLKYYVNSPDDVVYKNVSALVTSVEKDMTSSGIDSICSIKYNYNGKEYTDSTVIVHADIERGQNITIYVNAADPSKVSLTDLSKKANNDPSFLIVFGVIFVIVVAAVVSSFLKTKKKIKYEQQYRNNYTSSARSSADTSVWNMQLGEKSPSYNKPSYTSNTGGNVHIGSSVSRNTYSSAPPQTRYKPHKQSYSGPVLFAIVGSIFAIIGIIGFMVNVSAQVKRNDIIKNGVAIEATCTKVYAPGQGGSIIKVNGKIVNFYADVKYEYNGSEYKCARVEFWSQPKSGENVMVYIRENEPGICYSGGDNTAASMGTYVLFGVFAVLGGIFAAVGIGFIVSTRKNNRLAAQSLG